jgi:hypothetical protein
MLWPLARATARSAREFVIDVLRCQAGSHIFDQKTITFTGAGCRWPARSRPKGARITPKERRTCRACAATKPGTQAPELPAVRAAVCESATMLARTGGRGERGRSPPSATANLQGNRACVAVVAASGRRATRRTLLLAATVGGAHGRDEASRARAARHARLLIFSDRFCLTRTELASTVPDRRGPGASAEPGGVANDIARRAAAWVEVHRWCYVGRGSP